MSAPEAFSTIQFPGLLSVPDVREALDGHENDLRQRRRAVASVQLQELVTYAWGQDQMAADFKGSGATENPQWQEWCDVTAIMQSDWRWTQRRIVGNWNNPRQTFAISDPDKDHAPVKLDLMYYLGESARKALAIPTIRAYGSNRPGSYNNEIERLQLMAEPVVISYVMFVPDKDNPRPIMSGRVAPERLSPWLFFDYNSVLDTLGNAPNLAELKFMPFVPGRADDMKALLDVGLEGAETALAAQELQDRQVLKMIRSSELYKYRSGQIGERLYGTV
ncbi:MAG: hypothetical protein WBP26_03740 [Candidatus Saccharimonadales bacterium]